MQLLLQVLNVEPDAGKTPVKRDAILHADPGASFAALVDIDVQADGESVAVLVADKGEGDLAKDTPVLPVESPAFRSIRSKPMIAGVALPVPAEPASSDVPLPDLPVVPELPARPPGAATVILPEVAKPPPLLSKVPPRAEPGPANQPVEFRPARAVLAAPPVAGETPENRPVGGEFGLSRALEKASEKAVSVLRDTPGKAIDRALIAPKTPVATTRIDSAPIVDKTAPIEASKVEPAGPAAPKPAPETAQNAAPAPRFWDIADSEFRPRPGRYAQPHPTGPDPARPAPDAPQRSPVAPVHVTLPEGDAPPPPLRAERALYRYRY